jgi:hypothetical protein
VIVLDSQDRLFAAHRGNSRADIFDQGGQCLPRGDRSAGQAESGSKRTILSTRPIPSPKSTGQGHEQSGLQTWPAHRSREDGKARLLHPSATNFLTPNCRHRRVSRSILMVRFTPRRYRTKPSTNM